MNIDPDTQCLAQTFTLHKKASKRSSLDLFRTAIQKQHASSKQDRSTATTQCDTLYQKGRLNLCNKGHTNMERRNFWTTGDRVWYSTKIYINDIFAYIDIRK